MVGAVLVGRRDDFQKGNEAMAADVTNCQAAAAGQGNRLDHLFAPGPRRRLRHGNSAGDGWQRHRFNRLGTGVQRQHVRDVPIGVLLGEGIRNPPAAGHR